MKYLFRNKKNIFSIAREVPIALFLDFDGTIVPIAKTPDEVFLPARTKELLVKLSKDPRITLSIISGRAIKGLKEKVGIKNINYAGNHGLEIDCPGKKYFHHLSLSYRDALRKIKKSLRSDTSEMKGVILEDKKITLSIHYRLANKKEGDKVIKVVKKTIAPYLKHISLRRGKKVIEIRPTSLWNKGQAVKWILNNIGPKNSYPVYVGDDDTDEDAFEELKNQGLTIRVGNSKKSAAKFYLHDSDEVLKFLKKVCNLLLLSQEGKNGKKNI